MTRRTGKPRGGPPTSLEDIGRRLMKWGLGKLIGIGVGIVVVIWLLTGIYTVAPGEVGVVRQFGQEVAQTDPGLQYHLPGPIQRVDKVNMAEVRRLNVGFREVSPDTYETVLYEALMLTEDENMVDIHVIVYYRVKDASQYLFKVKEVEQTLKTATEAALRGVVGRNTIDYTLLEGRPEVANDTKEMLQQLMDAYQSGLLITEVKLQEVDAPEEVRDAFQDVVRAREDKEKVIREAEGYAADIVPRARGEKEQTILAAEAYKEQRIIRAQGDAEKFLNVLEEYLKAKDVTRQRLYLETMETILPGIEKIIIDKDAAEKIWLLLQQGEIENLVLPPAEGAP